MGSVDAETTNGSISVALAQHNGQDMKCETTNGSVRIALPGNYKGNVVAETTNGRIHTNFPVTSTSWSKRSLNGTINGGGPLLELETTNGSIHIDEI